MTNYARKQIEHVIKLADAIKAYYESYVYKENEARHLINGVQPKAVEVTHSDVSAFWDLVSTSLGSALVMMSREYEALKTFIKAAEAAEASEEANMPFSDEDVIEKGA